MLPESSKSPEQTLEPPLQSSATTPDDSISSRLRGFGPLGLIAILAILLTGNIAVGRAGGAPIFLPVGASLVLVWGWMSKTPGRELGYLRGHMFKRLGKLLRSKVEAKIVIVLVSSLWFGWDHYSSQGLAGVEQATIVGLVYGTIFTITGRLFMVMCAHAALDLAALAIIYWGLESRVAHLVFR